MASMLINQAQFLDDVDEEEDRNEQSLKQSIRSSNKDNEILSTYDGNENVLDNS